MTENDLLRRLVDSQAAQIALLEQRLEGLEDLLDDDEGLPEPPPADEMLKAVRELRESKIESPTWALPADIKDCGCPLYTCYGGVSCPRAQAVFI